MNQPIRTRARTLIGHEPRSLRYSRARCRSRTRRVNRPLGRCLGRQCQGSRLGRAGDFVSVAFAPRLLELDHVTCASTLNSLARHSTVLACYIYVGAHMMLLYAVRADHLCANDRRRRRYAMSTRMNIAVRGLFATPVAALEVPGSEGRNAELRAIILKKRETTPSVQASNAGGTRTARSPSGAALRSPSFSISPKRWPTA